MFGQDGRYFFYMQFVPAGDVLSALGYFNLWFQIGNATSSWQGAFLKNSVTGAVTASKDLNKISATNTIYAA